VRNHQRAITGELLQERRKRDASKPQRARVLQVGSLNFALGEPFESHREALALPPTCQRSSTVPGAVGACTGLAESTAERISVSSKIMAAPS